MSTLVKEVFYNKQWGGETVFEATMKDFESHKVHKLEVLNDIDFAEDLTPYPEFAHYLN